MPASYPILYLLAAVALGVLLRILLGLSTRYTGALAQFCLNLAALGLLLGAHLLLLYRVLQQAGVPQAFAPALVVSLCTGLVALLFLCFRFWVAKKRPLSEEQKSILQDL